MPNGIQLIREEHGVYIVSVYCHHCERQIGVAMVGIERQGMDAEHASQFMAENGGADLQDLLEQELEALRTRFPDPELTDDELERLSAYAPISLDDVLDAHQFFHHLGRDWMKHLPRPQQLEDDEDAATNPEEDTDAEDGTPISI
jgi:hypothetical protein